MRGRRCGGFPTEADAFRGTAVRMAAQDATACIAGAPTAVFAGYARRQHGDSQSQRRTVRTAAKAEWCVF